MPETKHWKAIDCLYAIGIILVVIGHSHSSDWTKFDYTPLYSIILFIYTFHMALFFTISGFLFSNSNAIIRDGYPHWISGKAIRLLLPYTFWTLIAIVPKYYIEHHGFDGLNFKFLLHSLFYPRDNIWGHFWFIPVMFLMYLVFGLLRIVFRNGNDTTYILAGTALSIIMFLVPVNTGLLCISDFKSMIPFFLFGILIHKYINAFFLSGSKSWKYIFCIGAFAVSWFLKDYAGSNKFMGLLVAILMIIVCWILSGLVPDYQIVRWISSHNYTYYIFSWFFQSVMMVICDRSGMGWVVTFFLMFAIGIIGPTLVIIIYNKLEFLHRHFIRLVLGMRDH